MSAYVLRADLHTGITTSRPIHLDGLLLAARERLEGILDLSVPLDGLAIDRGVYRASAGILVSNDPFGASPMRIRRVWRFRTEDAVDVGFFRTRDGSGAPVAKRERTLPVANSPWRNNFRAQEVLSGISAILWQFSGDPERVLALAKGIDCVGASSVSGFGRVRRWSVEECSAADDEVGWVSGGRILRNLPVELAPKGFREDGTTTRRAVERVMPPYWEASGRRECFVPSFTGLVSDQVAAETRLSLAA